MDDPATVYYSRRGGDVVRNDRTGDVVQISDRTDQNWRDPLEQSIVREIAEAASVPIRSVGNSRRFRAIRGRLHPGRCTAASVSDRRGRRLHCAGRRQVSASDRVDPRSVRRRRSGHVPRGGADLRRGCSGRSLVRLRCRATDRDQARDLDRSGLADIGEPVRDASALLGRRYFVTSALATAAADGPHGRSLSRPSPVLGVAAGRTMVKPDPAIHGYSANLDYFNAQ